MQENIDEALKKIVQEQLAPAKIIDLRSVESEDAYGDPILRIWVVYESEQNRLDWAKVSDMVELMRDHIIKATNGLDRFPILSFMIPEEADLAAG